MKITMSEFREDPRSILKMGIPDVIVLTVEDFKKATSANSAIVNVRDGHRFIVVDGEWGNVPIVEDTTIDDGYFSNEPFKRFTRRPKCWFWSRGVESGDFTAYRSCGPMNFEEVVI